MCVVEDKIVTEEPVVSSDTVEVNISLVNSVVDESVENDFDMSLVVEEIVEVDKDPEVSVDMNSVEVMLDGDVSEDMLTDTNVDVSVDNFGETEVSVLVNSVEDASVDDVSVDGMILKVDRSSDVVGVSEDMLTDTNVDVSVDIVGDSEVSVLIISVKLLSVEDILVTVDDSGV